MLFRSENFIQVLSHDEVVHGKCSMINKMPGLRGDKFSNLRTAYGFMYGHPGKKLLFMGQEFAQEREWSEARSLDWELLEVEEHKQMQAYVKALNHCYQEYNALSYNDCEEIGFQWMSCDRADDSIVAFVRRGSTRKKQLLFVCNFTPIEQEEYVIGVPCSGTYKEILSSDQVEFGGKGRLNGSLREKKIACDQMKCSLTLTVPPLSCCIFEYDYIEEKPVKVKTIKKK